MFCKTCLHDDPHTGGGIGVCICGCDGPIDGIKRPPPIVEHIIHTAVAYEDIRCGDVAELVSVNGALRVRKHRVGSRG